MLSSIELIGFKSFGKKAALSFESPISAIVGPNGSGKSNVAEGFRFVLGEQSMKSLRSRKGEDLIWGGSGVLPRSNRAAVKVIFDNSHRLLDIDFSEVVIERVVHRDGQNEYLLNGSKVRLKDIVRLLAGANIAGTGYQIISQGEADRILNANPRERREMVEDALGLKLYQHKKAESERKLIETDENMEKVSSLRRELAPHLKFLHRQVEKCEKAREMKDELTVLLSDYLARENAWIDAETSRIRDEKEHVEKELSTIENSIEETRALAPEKNGAASGDSTLRELEGELNDARRARGELAREMGRAEAKAEIVKERGLDSVPASDAREFAGSLIENIENAEAQDSIDGVRAALRVARDRISAFVQKLDGSEIAPDASALEDLERISSEFARAQEKERDLEEKLTHAREEASELREKEHESEREVLRLDGLKRDFLAQRRALLGAEDGLKNTRERFDEEVREGIALIGSEAGNWKDAGVPEGALSEERNEQEKRRRAVERLKIKIEESGVANSGEVVKEFNQTKERDDFLAKELADLERSASSLRQVIEELDAKIDTRFGEGLEKINEALQEFFVKLFGGGVAKLELEAPRKKRVSDEDDDEELIEEEEENPMRGLSIDVQLPRKKVRGLEVLSGGERALTSIALIFAMSQVNPPPFLILDETDAALDEANSRRYADMVKALGEKSQLILITHNRATMAAANELYGITMSADGVSKLLSVKLEEAEKVAK